MDSHDMFYNDIFIILFISSLYFIMDILISDTLKLVRRENIFFRHNDFLFHKNKARLNPLQIILEFVKYILISIDIILHYKFQNKWNIIFYNNC